VKNAILRLIGVRTMSLPHESGVLTRVQRESANPVDFLMFSRRLGGEPVARTGTMRCLRAPVVGLLVLLSCVFAPAAASAVTVDEIVQLSRSGVTEAVILALIDRDKSIFALEPEQLVTLKAQGVSERVVLAMLKSGREEGERAAQAAAELNSGFIMSSLPAGPEVVIVGHGPDVPNGGWSNRSLYGPPVDGLVGVPYGYGTFLPYANGGGRRRQHLPPPVSGFSPPIPMPQRFQSPFTAPFVSPFHEPPVARPIPLPPVQLPSSPPVK
jgi:hypothetical protein